MKRNFLSSLLVLLAVVPVQPASAVATAYVHNSAAFYLNDADTSLTGTAIAESSTSFLLDPTDIAMGTYVAAASADTRRGSLHGLADASLSGAYPGSYRIDTLSQLEETLSFSHAADVTFVMHIVGSFAALQPAALLQTVSTLSVAGTGPDARLQTSWTGGSASLSGFAQGDNEIIHFSPLGVDVLLRKTVHVEPGLDVFLSAKLELSVTPPSQGGSVAALFGDTAQLQIELPAGVTFTSQSGTFMTEVPAPVPLPPAFALLAAPLLMLRRRLARRTPAAVAALH